VNIRDQIPLLETLSEIDERLRVVDDELTLRRGGLAALKDEVAALAGTISVARESIATMEKTRGELHGEVRQMTNQIEKSREKLARSRNERETVAAQREMEELRKLVRDREDEIGKLDGLCDRARTSATDGETRRDALTRELEGDAEGVAQTLAQRQRERDELVAQRESAKKALPPVLFRRYETIRTRRPRAIAKTHDGTCNGCHIAVPPMMFQKMLRQEEFEQCPNCRRLLYYTPRPEADPSGSTLPA
jgi:predicted  nucleic acid-binding Zn-ribbon protein